MVISMPSRESGGDARGMEPGSDLHRRRRGHGPAASDGSASDAESSVDAHSSVDHGSFRSEGPPGNDEPSASSEPHPREPRRRRGTQAGRGFRTPSPPGRGENRPESTGVSPPGVPARPAPLVPHAFRPSSAPLAPPWLSRRQSPACSRSPDRSFRPGREAWTSISRHVLHVANYHRSPTMKCKTPAIGCAESWGGAVRWMGAPLAHVLLGMFAS